MLLFGPYFIPEHVYRSKFFWIALVVMIVASLVHHNFLKNGKYKQTFSGLFRVLNPSEPYITYTNQGRSGYVNYRSPEAAFALYYEFGAGEYVVAISIPSAANWEKETGLPLLRRDEVLHFIGRQVVKDQTTGGRGSYKIEGNWIYLYA